MPLFKIIKKEDSVDKVFDYEAKPIELAVTGKSIDFNSIQEASEKSSFRMDPLLEEKTGVASKKDEEIRTSVERLALEKLQSIEENAYQEAFELGKQEGFEQGLKNAKDEILTRLTTLDMSLEEIAKIRKKLMTYNEAKIVELCYAIATKLSMREIERDEKFVVDLIRNLSTNLQSDAETNIRLSEGDYEFIQTMSKKLDTEIEIFKHARLEADAKLDDGDVIIESNFGVIDASLKERVSKLWSVIEENLPRIKD